MENAKDATRDTQKQTERHTDEPDGEKTGQDTSRPTEGTGRWSRHNWTEEQSRVHANHSVCFGENGLLFPDEFVLANTHFMLSTMCIHVIFCE